MSAALKAQNRIVGPKRTKVPVSATTIRNDPFGNRDYIHPTVYKDMITKVVFLGAPSTGKTTIAEEMSKVYNIVWMPEYGREYWEKHQVDRRLEPRQLVEIAKGHIEREDKLCYEANKYLFIDTNAVTTYMFAIDYHGYSLPELELLALKAASRYDIVFLCADDILYDNTWDRPGDVKRHIFQKRIIADLKERRQPYIELKGTLGERIKTVKGVLKGFRKYDNPVNIGGIK